MLIIMNYIFVVMFMQPNFRWRPELETEVRRCFDHKADIRLKDLYHYLTKKKGGVCPVWMSTTVHEQMMQNARGEFFQARSKKSQKNRRGGDLDSPVQPSHCQGSISSAECAKRLVSIVLIVSIVFQSMHI